MACGDNLYKWKRITKPRVYSRSQQVTTNDDIQDWIQKVEHASSKAAAETFGTKYIPPRKTNSVKRVIEDAHIHEAAYSEAQDLLNQWVSEKIHLDNDLDDYSEDTWARKTKADIKLEWDHLLSSDTDLEIEETKRSNNYHRSTKGKGQRDSDPYAILYKDEGDLVSEILDEMWDKDVIGDTFKHNLETDSDKTYDPTTKMKLRHQQVKENREKRLKDKERKLKELQLKKDSQFKARQILQKEDKTIALQKKREEEEIQKQMAHIRKEMEEERQKKLEETTRLRTEEENLERKAYEALDIQREQEMKSLWKTKYQAEERRRGLLVKMKEMETRRTKQNFQILQRCFSSWYSIVIERRLAMGKAKATADWKLLLKSFNGWKSYSRAKQMDQQAWTHEENLKDLHRKTNMADIFYNHRLLSKCMTAWEIYVSQQQTERYFEENSKKTKTKMASFLEAAASGKLWSERSETPETSKDPRAKAKQVEALFNQPNKSPGTFSLNSTARYEMDEKSKKRASTPKEAFQVSRKHLKLTKKQIASMASKNCRNMDAHPPRDNAISCTCDKQTAHTKSEKPLCSYCGPNSQYPKTTVEQTCNESNTNRENKSKKAWEKDPYVVNNFEHRHAAQQKILEMQQKQIKEQQRLIEELQYLQKQQLLQQQLLQQEQAKRMLDNGGNGQQSDTSTIQNTLTHLQQHIQKLQQQILEGVSDGGDETISGDGEGGKNDCDTFKLDLTVMNVAEKSSISKDCRKEITTERTAKSSASITSDVSKTGGASSIATSRTTASHPRHNQFLKTMEDRASERAAIKKEREEKKHKQEELRLAQIMAEEEQRKLEEAELKQRRIEEHKEKKRLEKQREIEKQQFEERMKSLIVKAEAHREQALLKYRGWKPWRKLIEILRNKEEIGKMHNKKALMRKCLFSWHNIVQSELEHKYKMAEEFNTYRVITHAFTQWRQVKHASVIQEQKAERHYEFKSKLKVVREWVDFAAEEKVSMWHKERKSKEHNLERIKKKYFNLLRNMPVLRREMEEREIRRREMRKKVANLLPDFRASQNED